MFTIGKLAALAEVSADTLRYYEREGLVAPSGKSEGGYRLYDKAAADRIRFIKRAQQCGFTLAEIAELLSLRQTRSRDPHAAGDVEHARRPHRRLPAGHKPGRGLLHPRRTRALHDRGWRRRRAMKFELFHAPGCLACGAAQAALREAALQSAPAAEWREVNVLDELDYAVSLGVLTLPAPALDGELVFAGLPTPQQLRELLRARDAGTRSD